MATVARTRRSHDNDEPRPHRVAVVIVKAARGPNVVRTLSGFSDAVVAAAATLRMWFRAAKLHPRDVVAFTRGLGAPYNAPKRNAEPDDLLEFAEARSLNRFLERSGTLTENGQPVSVPTFCARQQYISHRQIVADVVRLMTEEKPGHDERD